MKTTIKTTTQYLHMQLFSRRRWRLVSGQVLSCCVYDNPQKCEAHACKHFIHVWPLGRSGCSYAGRELHDLPPSTIEILRSLCHLPAKNLHEQSTFLQNNLLTFSKWGGAIKFVTYFLHMVSIKSFIVSLFPIAWGMSSMNTAGT